MGEVVNLPLKPSFARDVRQAQPFPAESPTSFATPIRPNEPASRFAEHVYALNRLSPECERVGRRALFAFGRGVDGCGYCTDRREVARAIVHLESLPDDASNVAHFHARIARLAALAVLEPFQPEPPTDEVA
jgi:hypothetical protein